TMIRRCLPLLAVLAGLAWFGAAVAADDDKDFKTLFNGKDFTGFKFELAGKDADPAKTFMVKEGVIVVTGKPNGYFYTDKSYKNYVLRFDWMYVRPKGLEDDEKFLGNSGCLVHLQPPHKVWPKCVEVQGMNKEHAKIFAIGGAKGTYKFDADTLKKVPKPVCPCTI